MNSRRGRIAWILLGVALLAWLIYESGPSRIASDLALIGTGLAVVVLLEFAVDGFNTLGWWFTFPPDLHGSQRDSPRGLDGWGAGESLPAPWGFSHRDRGGYSHDLKSHLQPLEGHFYSVGYVSHVAPHRAIAPIFARGAGGFLYDTRLRARLSAPAIARLY